ncbi:MAG: prepilin-type N-terminal cleavage/methylation domain-containing protein [Magnetococcales bacterium]|nr:prepilin-type N-terminal cleavage/methylation domain-containing protein [Magnetococcales bacterium]
MTMITTRGNLPVRQARRGEGGFTLIELMVVVAIIAILASIGIPKMTAFIKTSETAEAVEQMGRISQALRGYIDSHPSMTTADVVTALASNNALTAQGSTNIGVGSLSTLIPHLTLASTAKFNYVANVAAVSADSTVAPGVKKDDLAICIEARNATTDTATTNKAGLIWSLIKPVANASLWEENVYRSSYVNNNLTYQSGGECSAAGAAQDPS